ncbi:hypothetical protein ABPG74_019654 [Tetrahymena malaccensis]
MLHIQFLFQIGVLFIQIIIQASQPINQNIQIQLIQTGSIQFFEIIQLINQSIYSLIVDQNLHITHQSINQSTNQSIIQSINQEIGILTIKYFNKFYQFEIHDDNYTNQDF